MAENTYTITDLSRLWDEYVVTFACRWLVQGKWLWERPAEGKQAATRAERVKIKDHKTFIEFLKEKE